MIDSLRLINPSGLLPPGGTFSPLQLSGLLAWFDAGDAVTIFQDSGFASPATALNDPVGGWRDKSGLGNDVFQVTSNKRPLLKPGGLNGLATLLFDGANDVLISASNFVAGSAGLSLFMVAKATTTGANATLAGVELTGKLQKASTNFATGYISANGSSWTTQVTGTSLDTNWHLFGFVSGSTETYLRRDLADNGSRLASGPSSLGSSANAFGIFGRALAEFCAGEVGEVLVYNRPFTTSQVASIEGYLRSKWGI